MKKIFFISAILLLVSVKSLFAQVTLDTITSLRHSNSSKPAIYKSPDGKFYKVQFLKDSQAGNVGIASDHCGEDDFRGSARKGPKTSIAPNLVRVFPTIKSLISALPADTTMIRRLKSLSTQLKNKRQPEENMNARLATGIFLFAIKREPDNDYHIIIGDKKNFQQATLLNVELSGIGATNKVELQKVRDFFEDNFVDVCGSKYVSFTENPIPIKLEGSLFYDVDHKPGEVGPGALKPKTSWEIHPITKISKN
jgi:hypothetical protein